MWVFYSLLMLGKHSVVLPACSCNCCFFAFEELWLVSVLQDRATQRIKDQLANRFINNDKNCYLSTAVCVCACVCVRVRGCVPCGSLDRHQIQTVFVFLCLIWVSVCRLAAKTLLLQILLDKRRAAATRQPDALIRAGTAKSEWAWKDQLTRLLQSTWPPHSHSRNVQLLLNEFQTERKRVN